jgi:hypothetical protein
MDDLVANAMEALSLWAEDEAMPKVRSIEEIVADRDIATELAASALLISVPLQFQRVGPAKGPHQSLRDSFSKGEA